LTLCGVSMLLAFTFAGACLFQIEGSATHESSVKELLNRDIINAETSTILTGTLNGPPEFANDRLYLVVDVEEISTNRFKRAATGVVSLTANFKTPANRDE